MFSLYTLWTVSLFELKTLLRSWFFRIFAVTSLILILIINFLFFTSGRMPWALRSIPSAIPYINTFMINVVQAIIAIFLSSEFLSQDRKLNSTDTIYMRSMTNAEYVFGKTIGIVLIFMGLNFLVLFGAFLNNLFFSDVPVRYGSYFVYPILLSIPTLVFILGLSFGIISILRNQAVTFVLLLAYISGTLFYFGNIFYYYLDYMGYNLPLFSSEIVGITGLTQIIAHRGLYFLTGLGLICFTSLKLPRLPQSRIVNTIVIVVMAVCFSSAIYLSYVYVSSFTRGKDLRTEMKALNNSVVTKPRVSVNSCNLDITHSGSTMSVISRMIVSNTTESFISEFTFSLNPGFNISNVNIGNESASFDQHLHVITMNSQSPLAPGDSALVTISYSGVFDEDACYLTIDEEERVKVNNIFFAKIDKQYGFLNPSYVMLTPECLWYPVSGVPSGSVFPESYIRDLTRYSLTVKTKPGLTVITQGDISEISDGIFSVQNDIPLPGLTLIIGDYLKKSITVTDTVFVNNEQKATDVEYSVMVFRGHDFFSKIFEDVMDRLPDLITDMKDQAEFQANQDYPYQRFSLVETPVQFYTYQYPWKTYTECVQPEMMLIQEKAIYLRSADFKTRLAQNNRRGGRGREMSPEDLKTNLLRSFLYETVPSNNRQSISLGSLQAGTMGGISLRRLFIFDWSPSYSPNYTLSPYWYDFVTILDSQTLPILDAMTSFYNVYGISTAQTFNRQIGGNQGLTTNELACQLLDNEGFSGLMEQNPTPPIYMAALNLKAYELYGYLASVVGIEQFPDYYRSFKEQYRFTRIPIDSLLADISRKYNVDCAPFLDRWYNSKGLPEFLFSEVTLTTLIENMRTVYQLRFTATNLRSSQGTFMIEAPVRGIETYPMFYTLAPYQSKEIGIVLEGQPQQLSFNCIVARNLPLQFDQTFGVIEQDEQAEVFEGELVLDTTPNYYEPGVIIVDNEEPGFQILSQPKEPRFTKFMPLYNEKNEYVAFNMNRPPYRWEKSINEKFFGTRKAAVFKRSGNGDLVVSWSAGIEDNGMYDVYCHTPDLVSNNRRNRNMLTYLSFRIHSDDGVHEITVDPETAVNNWTYIGRFYLSHGEAVVEMTDKSSGRFVFADAIKWVKK